MLNKIKLFFWLIIILAVAYFVSVNTEPKVSVKLLPNYQTPEASISLVAVISMVVGAFIVLIFTVIDWFSYKMEKRKLKKQLAHLEEDLNKCRKEKEELEKEIEKLTKEKAFPENESLNLEKEEEENGTLRQGLHEGEKPEEKSEQSPSDKKE